jgi:hypothetical protein
MARENAVEAMLPRHAWLMLNSVKEFVKTVVGRPRHANIVNGLNRYTAATEAALHLLDSLGETKLVDMIAASDLTIWKRLFADPMSTRVYTIIVKS